MNAQSREPRAARFQANLSALKTQAAATLLVAASTLAGATENWPAWRGAGGSGICQETNLPLRWNTNENVRWRVALPDRGNSTPIVWGDRVFITQAVESRRTVMCLNRRDGKLLWQAGPVWVEKEQTYPDNPPCSPSPITDGRCVIAWFGSAGVYCYDFRGRELWHRDLGRQSHQWGYAASPVLDVLVLRARPKFECLATNSIGGEPMNASLAVSDAEIFIRTDKGLWCIGATARP